MTSKTFVDYETVVDADWLNDLDYLSYNIFTFTDGTTDLTVNGISTFSGIATFSSDVICSTLNATGDTTAGDNAAMGYTATEGLILTGQGSTNDITIKNDADADVLVIPTGTTNVDIVGVTTASTFEPDGDTAAGDAAAIGYTAIEGLILTGQGSTNDLTVKNDADADVLVIPTGTTNVDIVGVATAATFEPDGDTSAGDAAAIGYTAIEGLILTGQGSTNDITIKNDADATVIDIPTGTTNVDIVGVATALTFEPDGDTAAGDAAAIGYTATEGLILTGQGSTNDLTFKNDADATVFAILTGTQNVDFVPGTQLLVDRTTEDAAFVNFQATIDADATSAISSLTTSGAVTHHIQIELNGTTAWIPCSTTDPS